MSKMDQDIVVSTRMRLARNLSNLPFSSKMSVEQEKELAKRISRCVNGGHDFTEYEMNNLNATERQVLVERHLASRELIHKPNALLLISKDENISLLVGEEDHVRIQCILPGFSVQETDSLTRALDAIIAREGYAFDDKLGFLTSCPTNVGTGMRSSVMLHLSALTMTGQIQNLLETVGKFGFTMRGFYGEGSAADGDMYQLSNQVTLGVSEEEIIQSLTQVVRTIIDKEREVRNSLIKYDKGALSDRLHRSLGILKYARRLSSSEMMQRISDIKLGLSLNMFEGVTNEEIEQLITRCQPASIEAAAGQELSQDARDDARAKAVRVALQHCQVY